MKTKLVQTVAVAMFCVVASSPAALGQSVASLVPTSPLTTAGLSTPTVSIFPYTAIQMAEILEGTGLITLPTVPTASCPDVTIEPSNFGVAQAGASLADLRTCTIENLLSSPDWLSVSQTVATPSAFKNLASSAKAVAAQNPGISPQNLVLQAVQAAGLGQHSAIEDVPAPYVAFLALTATPDGPQTKWHMAGHGTGWTDMVGMRYMAATDDLLMAEYGTLTGGGGGNGPTPSGPSSFPPFGSWPSDASLTATRAIRSDRMLLGIAFIHLGTYQANMNGNLGNSLDALGLASIANFADSGILWGLKMHGGQSDVKLTNLMLLSFANMAQFMGTGAKLNIENGAFLDGILRYGNMEFPDGYARVSPATGGQIFNVQPGTSAIVQTIANDGNSDSGFSVFNSGALSAYGILSTVTRNLPSDAALTEQGSTAWSVEISQGQAAKTSYSWFVPGIGLGMNDGVLTGIDQDPTIFQESGTTYQYTHYEALTAVVEQELPSTTYSTADVWGCAFWSFGLAAQAVGGTVAVWGTAVASGVVTAGPGGAVAVAGGALWVIGGLSAMFGSMDDCQQVPTYNAGFYHETGGFISYWGAYGWLGEGLSLAGGLVQIYGTVTQDVLKEYFEAIPYDNAPEISGYNYGKQTAGYARTNAENIAKFNLPQFRPIAGLPGEAYITIEFLCAGYGEYYAATPGYGLSGNTNPALEGTELCLRVEVGSLAAGTLEANQGYGAVDYHAKGLANTGYVKVNGSPVVNNAPVEVNADGDGLNYQ